MTAETGATPLPRFNAVTRMVSLDTLVRATCWLVVCSIVVFWRLGYASLLDPDEAHYAELTREMVRAKSWLVPLLDGVPYIDKPVLFHWLQGASVAVLGESEFAVRLPTALAAIATFMVTRWAGAALFGPVIGEWSAIMFATFPATFALSSVALFDMVFTLFLFGSVACFTVAVCRPASARAVPFVGFALLALAVMIKGPIALLLMALWAGLVRLLRRRGDYVLGRLNWTLGIAAVMIAVSPWFLWMYATFGRAFVDRYLLAGNLWYFTQPIHFSNRSVSHTYYARVFVTAFFPWSLVTLGRGVQAFKRRDHEMATEEMLLWAWIAVVVVFFTVARFKLDHYIFPAAPAVAIVGARAWLSTRNERTRSNTITWSIVAVGATLIVASAVCAAVMYRLDLGLDWTAILLPMALGASGIALLVQIVTPRGAALPTPAVVVGGLLAAYAIVVVIGFPVLERTRPMAHVARRIASRTKPTDPVGIYRLERWRASLRYYVNRPVTRLEEPSQVRTFLSESQGARVVMLRSDFEMLRAAGLPLEAIYSRRGVVGTTGRVLRRQRWDLLVIATMSP